MSVKTYTKTGNAATTQVKLDKVVFGQDVQSHELIKQAYVTYLSNGRNANANVKTRGEVRGGGKKPWKQKGTGRARFGSSRNPIWRHGGIVFGPTGYENYTKKLNQKAKRTALRQALSIAAKEGNIKIAENLSAIETKTAELAKFLAKIEAGNSVLLVVEKRDSDKEAAARNLQKVKVAGASNLNVFDVVNADSIVIEQKALPIINNWLAIEGAK